MANFDIPQLKLLSSTAWGRHQKLIILFLVTTVLGLAVSFFFYNQYTRAQKELKSLKKGLTEAQKPKETTNDVAKIVAEVGKLIKLPEGEVPSIATISDIEKLKDQPFFQNGKNGNILLVYNKASKAILYDPLEKRVIEVAPLGSASTQIKAKIALRNGTDKAGLAAKVEEEIRQTYPEINIAVKDNTIKNNYDKTIVIVLNEDAQKDASELAKTLDAEIANLPAGEPKPEGVDILVILGKDKV